MNCLTARVALALSLLVSLPGLGDAGARPPVPQRAAEGVSVNARVMQDARPVLDLLITAHLLANLLEQGEIVVDAHASRELADVLRPLSDVRSLRPTEATALDSAIRVALAPSQLLVLAQARAALESRAQAFMARARFATPDGPLNLTLVRYGLMVPGGQATVNLLLGTQLNPFSQAGGHATLLARLLALLEG
jgi:hypothetical protein